ncbi:bZIP transcription factor 60 [Eucalyptus grandis]|uniref:bZIP transcription factor 60 n=1 Tax=Eucalyptus grandis TaxID=71139 RepID=UPI00192E7E05|nr:bZIP transcription factor 60 [Eucalyptus grandis]
MENPDLPGDDLALEFDFQSLFDELSPDAAGLLDASDVDASSPGSLSSWIGEIEGMLMKDDEEAVAVEPSQEVFDRFFAGLLVDSPEGGPAEATDGASDKESNSSDGGGGGGGERDEKLVVGDNELSEDADDDDPVSKKQRRQLRNKDAAARSRERKRSYVKELEMKSKYMEGECRRLGRLLQCFVAENQALRLNLENGGAYGATMAKQESAVLLLESLLLGSLLWFLGIMCLFTRPVSLQPCPVAPPLENVGEKDLRSWAPRGIRGHAFEVSAAHSFVMTRRCRASRTKMKPCYLVPRALA